MAGLKSVPSRLSYPVCFLPPLFSFLILRSADTQPKGSLPLPLGFRFRPIGSGNRQVPPLPQHTSCPPLLPSVSHHRPSAAFLWRPSGIPRFHPLLLPRCPADAILRHSQYFIIWNLSSTKTALPQDFTGRLEPLVDVKDCFFIQWRTGEGLLYGPDGFLSKKVQSDRLNGFVVQRIGRPLIKVMKCLFIVQKNGGYNLSQLFEVCCSNRSVLK